MGEAFLDYAKELFRQGKLQQAYDIAHLVSFNDCNCPGVRPLLAIYSVLLNGTTSDLLRVNCYKVLNVSSSASTDEITHRFATLKKLIAQARSPYTVVDRFSTAAAAEEANSLLNFAFQVLSDEKSRSRFDAKRKKPRVLPPLPRPLAEKRKRELTVPPPPPLAEKKKPQVVLPPPPAPVGGKRKREIIPCPTESKKRQSESEKPTIFKRIRVVRSDETWEGYSKLTKSNDCRSSANTAAAC
ncbi:hypothetical protein LINPERPRIM_LOCUS26539 [Linum perenne]